MSSASIRGARKSAAAVTGTVSTSIHSSSARSGAKVRTGSRSWVVLPVSTIRAPESAAIARIVAALRGLRSGSGGAIGTAITPACWQAMKARMKWALSVARTSARSPGRADCWRRAAIARASRSSEAWVITSDSSCPSLRMVKARSSARCCAFSDSSAEMVETCPGVPNVSLPVVTTTTRGVHRALRRVVGCGAIRRTAAPAPGSAARGGTGSPFSGARRSSPPDGRANTPHTLAGPSGAGQRFTGRPG